MTTVRDDQALSRLEIVVLARLSVTKPPSEATLAKDIAKLTSPTEQGARALEATGSVLTSLRRRGLINNRTLTENGNRSLRAAFGLEKTPTWTRVRDVHLPALALGLEAGSQEAFKTMKTLKAISTHLVCSHLGLAKASTLDQVCDGLIRRAFGMPDGPLTLRRLRAYALVSQSPEPVNREATGSATMVGERIASRLLGQPLKVKRDTQRALASRWLYNVEAAPRVRFESKGPRASSIVSDPPTTPTLAPPPAQPIPVSLDTLLTLVREAIPLIGSDGRFGKEKVFVSAIWQRLERDNQLPDLSLDRFKRWLVTANREQKLDLARADLVGAMDPKLVRESEIEDLGATFHFVVDRRANGSGQGHHAR